MADIARITMPDGNTYDLKDAGAREAIEQLSGYTVYLGVTSTELTDGSTVKNVTVNGEIYPADKGYIVNYGSKEFIYNGTAWQEFGDLSGLGSLAFKNSASGSFKPAGSVSAIELNTATVNSITAVGTLPTFTASGETLTITAGTLPTRGTDVTVATGVKTQPAFVAADTSVTVS